MSNDDMKLVDGLRAEGSGQPSQEEMEEARRQQQAQADQLVEQINDADTSINDGMSTKDQYANRHTEIVKRVLNRLKLQNVDLNQQTIMQIAQTIESLMKERITLSFIDYLQNEGVIEDIYDIITEEAEEEMVGYFQVKQDLSVNPEDVENLEL